MGKGKGKGKDAGTRKAGGAGASARRTPGSFLPVPPKMKKKDYERELLALQIELVKAQYWIKGAGERVLIIFEGRDTAGKGGTIKRFREHLNPRGAPHVALPAPSDRERTQFYFQRYLAHMPAGGEVVFFDRSWYNRAGVERVMGFCTVPQCTLFLRQVPSLESGLIDDGIRLFKLYLSVNPDVQVARLKARPRRPAEDVEAEPHGHGGPEAVRCLHRSAERHVRAHPHEAISVDRGQLERQEDGPHQRHPSRLAPSAV